MNEVKMKTLYFYIGLPKIGITSMYEYNPPYISDFEIFGPNIVLAP
jgi:hypothetical protein